MMPGSDDAEQVDVSKIMGPDLRDELVQANLVEFAAQNLNALDSTQSANLLLNIMYSLLDEIDNKPESYNPKKRYLFILHPSFQQSNPSLVF